MAGSVRTVIRRKPVFEIFIRHVIYRRYRKTVHAASSGGQDISFNRIPQMQHPPGSNSHLHGCYIEKPAFLIDTDIRGYEYTVKPRTSAGLKYLLYCSGIKIHIRYHRCLLATGSCIFDKLHHRSSEFKTSLFGLELFSQQFFDR